jgi:hypothetical protein
VRWLTGPAVSRLGVLLAVSAGLPLPAQLGRETSVPRHLADDEEFQLPLGAILEHGRLLFMANWTAEEGGGRPLMNLKTAVAHHRL